MNPTTFQFMYAFGFSIEYLTPACAARLITKSIPLVEKVHLISPSSVKSI